MGGCTCLYICLFVFFSYLKIQSTKSNRDWWQYRLELPKLNYHPWMAADEDMVSHVLSHVV